MEAGGQLIGVDSPHHVGPGSNLSSLGLAVNDYRLSCFMAQETTLDP